MQPKTPQEFIEKWKNSTLGERQAAHSHFNDLCALLGVENPTDADPKGAWYCFERGARKTSGGKGWADVWKRGHFGWEYKGKHKDLDAAYAQLQQYAVALENPPLLVVCDTEEFRIHTNWTNTVSETRVIQLEDLINLQHRIDLKAIFEEPERLKPRKTRDALTAEMAERFARLARTLAERGHNPQLVAHFLNRLIFCMYAEDSDLLPNNMFTRLLTNSLMNPGDFNEDCGNLFRVMKEGGRFGLEKVEWFNGNLFDDDMIVPLNRRDIAEVHAAAEMNWSDIDPSILGTLFERGLDPDKRGQLGAHYTDREKIMLIVKPVIRRPLQAEWKILKRKIASEMEKAEAAKSPATAKKHKETAAKLHRDYVDKLAGLRVLDPACGSGNFLYLALRTLKDLEHKANLEAEELGLKRGEPKVGPQVVNGIELNLYAAELARVSVWIGELQWMKRHGFDVSKNPILKPLMTIEQRDALLNSDGSEAVWPKADFIIGNPPFLGDRKMIRGLGEPYVLMLRDRFGDRIPGGSDLVCYWFEKARRAVESGNSEAAGLVATNSVRGGANRRVLDRISESGVIFEAWSDEPWILDGAAVRVSLVCFAAKGHSHKIELNGEEASAIFSDLTSGGSGSVVDLTKSIPLRQNEDKAFIGTQKNGPFEISGDSARQMLSAALNPNGRPNSDVLHPWINGSGIVQNRDDTWIIDFGPRMPEQDAALYEAPFHHVVLHVQPTRVNLRRQWHRTKWWLHGDPRPAMRLAIAGCTRYMATPRVSKHRVFVWSHTAILPDSAVVAIARDDDTTFGILHSKFHEFWALRLGTSLEDRPRYTPSTCFETFPFPEGLTPDIPANAHGKEKRAIAIAETAKRLNELREAWLNPTDLVKRVPEVAPGYPDRILPKDAKAEKELKKRTLTNLYNARPAWLVNAHKALDEAVAAAYGWPADLSDDEILNVCSNSTRNARNNRRIEPDWASGGEMAVPSYQSMMLPLLTGARDKAGEITTSEAIDYVVKLMNLTEADRSQLRASGRQTVLSNRLSWARLYLAHAGLLQSTGHGRFQITERGRQFLTANPQPLDNRTLMQFPEFASWQEHVKKTAATRTKTLPDDKGSDQVAEQDPLTTEERIETAYTTLAAELRAELLERLYQVSSTQFEQVIIDLLIAMGYGGGRSEMGKAIGKSGDQGLDGVIREDALGLDVVYIQAKKHKLNSTIGRPDIQSFAGSLEGARATKGLFVTTATFSQQARDYVEKISKRIILLDGEELADLMIRHNVGVRISETYEIKKVDEEYFSE